MKMHELKTWPNYFEHMLSGAMPFNVRNDMDRNFQRGEYAHFREWNPDKQEYTGRDIIGEVTFVFATFGLSQGHVAFGFKKLKETTYTADGHLKFKFFGGADALFASQPLRDEALKLFGDIPADEMMVRCAREHTEALDPAAMTFIGLTVDDEPVELSPFKYAMGQKVAIKFHARTYTVTRRVEKEDGISYGLTADDGETMRANEDRVKPWSEPVGPDHLRAADKAAGMAAPADSTTKGTVYFKPIGFKFAMGEIVDVLRPGSTDVAFAGEIVERKERKGGDPCYGLLIAGNDEMTITTYPEARLQRRD